MTSGGGELVVSVDLFGRTVVAGRARIDRRRGSSTTSFAYESGYLADPDAYPIDPALGFDSRGGVVAGLPGAFADCAPDRWGRRLITKRIRAAERDMASQGGRAGTSPPRALGDLDFLLGVSDATRQGALRFAHPGREVFEHPDADVPRSVQLPELLHAADRVARDDDDDLSAVKLLLKAGTATIGGDRPKASLIGDDGRLHIAKFPHPHDEWDVMAWEKTALDLAERARLAVPNRRLLHVSGRAVLLVERFDRIHDDGRDPRSPRRIGYMSAMTMVGGTDGGDHDYLDVGAELSDVSGGADADLEALWRRIAFSVAIHNTDDHLRKHGLLRGPRGWRLSPVFDLNPNPEVSEERATAIAGATGRRDEIEALLLTAPDFGLTSRRAHEVLREVSDATRDWRSVAATNGLGSPQIDRFVDAFEGLRGELDAPAASQGLRSPRWS